MTREKAIQFYDRIIEKNGNVSIQDFKDFGYTEGQAIENLIRMSNKTRESIVSSARMMKQKMEG